MANEIKAPVAEVADGQARVVPDRNQEVNDEVASGAWVPALNGHRRLEPGDEGVLRFERHYANGGGEWRFVRD